MKTPPELTAFVLPKSDAPLAECEDAIGLACGVDGNWLRVALSDGATASSFSGLWAQMLVQAFVSNAMRSAEDVRQAVRLIAPSWVLEVFGKARPWHTLEHARKGAFASLAALEISLDGTLEWWGVTAGDSCVMHFRGNCLLSSFPCQLPDDFDNQPTLISTQNERNDSLDANFAYRGGKGELGDFLLLTTDAFAAMILGAPDQVEGLRIALGSAEQFSVFVAQARASGELRDDDVAVIAMQL